ncbi:MAG: hypothetical protein KJ578_11880 [Bacteroidetes bacterium]|nr:hypothetical protein [Bacteroidota bacterium]MBU1577897.1 hypothetical protein [Bacteroidota bacterium]MBU2558469.1 hypothetical protein [Bacteroidota bacterium]
MNVQKFSFLLLGLLMLFTANEVFAGKRKMQVSASENDATIYVDGVKSGTGRVNIVVLDNSCVTVKVEKIGFLEETITFCNRKNSAKLPKTYYIEMRRDDSYDASVQLDIANIDMEVRTQKSYDDAWKLMNQIVVNYIDAIEITDKETGYIRTSWEVQSYTQNTIRTRIIVKLGSEDPLAFKVKLVSEISRQPLTSVKADELYREWDRVLRKYANLMPEIQSRL